VWVGGAGDYELNAWAWLVHMAPTERLNEMAVKPLVDLMIKLKKNRSTG